MRCDRGTHGGGLARLLGLALLAAGAGVWVAAPLALAQDEAAEEAEAPDPEEAEESLEADDSPEVEAPAEDDADDAAPTEDEDEADVPEETEEEADASPASIGDDADEEAKWRERHREMLDGVRRSEARLEAAQEQRSKLGDRYSYGGRSRKEIVSELDHAVRAVQRAQRDLDRFYEEARRADVPPGWVREDD
jgi:hypothetical protein